MKAIWLLPVLLCWLAACDRKLDLPDVEGKKSLALLGELVADDSFHLRAGQSVSLASGNDLKFEVLQGIAVYAADGQNHIPLAGREDSATARLFTIPFSSSQKVQPKHSYTIVAAHPALGTVTAAIDIPGQFTATLIDTASVLYSSASVMRVRFRIDDPGNETNYYVIEALKQDGIMMQDSFFYDNKWWGLYENIDMYYALLQQGLQLSVKTDTIYNDSYVRRILYTDDMNTDNVPEKGIYNRNRRVLLKDKNFNGSSYTSQVYIPLDTTSFSLAEGGLVQLFIKSVPENYFQFLKAYESFSDAGGFSTFSQPVKVEGNVTNGVGMIGGAYVIKIPLYFDYNF